MRHNFQVETFDAKEERDRCFAELRKDHPAIVRFSSAHAIEGAGKILPNYAGRLETRKADAHTTIVIHGRVLPVCKSLWFVAWPIQLADPRPKARTIELEPCSPRRRRDARFARRHGGKTRYSRRQLLKRLDRKAFNRQSLPRIV